MAARLPTMQLPPLDRDGAVGRDCADLADVRVPPVIGRYTDDEMAPRPVGYYDGQLEPGATGRMVRTECNPTGAWGSARHLFDALQVSEGDRYAEDDSLRPKRFVLTMTCVRCGIVRELRGQLDPDDGAVPGDRQASRVEPVPLQAGELLAQEISRDHVWADEWNLVWTVYRDGRPVGWMASQRGPHGKRYVAGAFGRRYDNSSTVEKGSSAAAVLRKLAATRTQVTVDS